MVRLSVIIIALVSVFNFSMALPSKQLTPAQALSRQSFCSSFCASRSFANFICSSSPGCSVQTCTGFGGAPGFQCATSNSGGGDPSPLPTPDGSCTYTSELNGSTLSNARCSCPNGTSATGVSLSFTDPAKQAKAVAYVACIDGFLSENCTPAFNSAVSVGKSQCCDEVGGTFSSGTCSF